MAEETRVRMRAARRQAMETAKKMQKEGNLTEDDLKSAETQIQKLTDKFVADVDVQLTSKEADIMKI
jgi:ribosome recycling factor